MAFPSLQHALADSSVTDPMNSARKYLPRDVLDSILTRESVKAALKRCSVGRKFWSPSSKNVADVVFSKNLKKLFVILLYLDIPWDVQKIHEAGFTDDDLPLRWRKPGDMDRECLQSSINPNKLFRPPKQWGFHLAENLTVKQWIVLAPFFGTTGEHQKLHPLCPLPLIRAEGVIHNDRNVVFKAKIRSSHMVGFKDIEDSSSLDVALKEFRYEKDFDQERSNLSALRKLPNTKHIAQSLATFSQGEKSYILSLWARGGDLDNFWQTHDGVTRDSKLALWSLEQMLGLVRALYALHEELGDAVNCRHGDLKPANILHFTSGKEEDTLSILKITDFGISRIHQEATFDRLGKPTITGATSPSYEAPEAVAPKAARSRKYDIWSIGCIFLEFIMWLVQDWNAVQSFASARNSTSVQVGGATPSHFYKIDKDDVIVHPEVSKIINTLGRMPQSAPNTALGRLLSIIKDDLIKIDSADRTNAEGLCKRLDAIVSKAKSDPAYLWNSRF
ncbi:protein kinase domain-containing protein [Colletotrichum fioriniae PJ7]|uniref:Protein kinase domain-containing protein n=1 Tax=Colletotrichum fioriniae PJ7 TaxID=1445577 RepID=A0A010RS76_9PEZI|nr:protein kinase domain-containing protein [Colletotrichum fioriniae PJ7]